MSGPTLLRPGGLLATKWSPPQAVLDKHKPIDYIIDWVKAKMKKNTSPADRILLLQSATGSGKSTILPPELYHVFFNDDKRNITCLQPQVYNAVSMPGNIIPFHTKEALKASGKGSRTPLELGENIGYQTGVFVRVPVKGIIFMTVGVLMQQLNIMSDEEFMKKYSFIIVDEAHKRSIDTDIVMSALKAFVNRNYKNPQCPLIVITSATFDTERYCDWILDSVKKPDRYQNIINVKGQTSYPIHEVFLKYEAKDMINAAVDRIVQIHEEFASDFGVEPDKEPKEEDRLMLKADADAKKKEDTFFRDILVFVTGARDVDDLKKKMNDLNANHPFFQKYPVLPIGLTSDVVKRRDLDYTYLDKEIEDLVVEVRTGKQKKGEETTTSIEIKKPTRRVIIATNVGEVGITYHALKHVIDTGMHKSKEVAPTIGASALILKPITQGIHTQRKGRTGRRAPGYSFPLFTEENYNKMLVDELPGMLREDVTQTLLNLIIMRVDPENKGNEYKPVELFGPQPPDVKFKIKEARKEIAKQFKDAKYDVTKLDLLDLPSADSLHASMDKLYTLGAIDSNGCPTPLGFLMNKFRYISFESVKMILSGYAWKAPISDLVTIAAMVNQGTFLVSRKLRKNRAEAEYRNAGISSLSSKAKQIVPNYVSLYNSLLIADDFINTLVLFYEFQEQVEKQFTGEAEKDLGTLEEWCDNRGISFSSLINALDERDQVIQTLAMIGFNPFQNSQKELRHVLSCYNNCGKRDLIDRVKVLKQCIFEGYKMNLAEWHPRARAYISRQSHTYLLVDNPIVTGRKDILREGDSNPRFIIFDEIGLKSNPATGIYQSSVGLISVLDGYVPIDPHFDT
jgi:HrpA-like RNA helicase